MSIPSRLSSLGLAVTLTAGLTAALAGGAPAAAATAEPGALVAQAEAPPRGGRIDVDVQVGDDPAAGRERAAGDRTTTWIIGLSTGAAILLVLVLIVLARGDRRSDAAA